MKSKSSKRKIKTRRKRTATLRQSRRLDSRTSRSRRPLLRRADSRWAGECREPSLEWAGRAALVWADRLVRLALAVLAVRLVEAQVVVARAAAEAKGRSRRD